MTVHNLKPHLAHSSSTLAPTDEELNLIFRPIFERIGADAIRREQTRELPFDAVNELRDAGLGRLRIPKTYGGLGASLPQLFRLLTELAEADSNFPQIFRAHSAFVEQRLNNLEGKEQDFWFPKIVAGDLVGAGMAEKNEATKTTVTLTRQNDQWVVNGEKYYCTGTLYADWVSVSTIDGEDRVSVIVSTTAPGVTRVDDWNGFGQRLTASGTTKFDQVPVSEEHIIRRFTDHEIFRDDSYITAFYQLFHLAALAGISRAILRDGIDFVQKKTRAFGVPGLSSPRTDPLVQRVVGRLSSLSFAAESLVQTIAQHLEKTYQARLADTADKDLYVEADIKTHQAQQIVINLVLEAATLLFEVGGASASSESLRLDRHWRNARTLASHNPAIFRERGLGDFYLNGITPTSAWRTRFQKAKEAGDDNAQHAATEEGVGV